MKKGCNEQFSMFQKKKQLAEEKSEYVSGYNETYKRIRS